MKAKKTVNLELSFTYEQLRDIVVKYVENTNQFKDIFPNDSAILIVSDSYTKFTLTISKKEDIK